MKLGLTKAIEATTQGKTVVSVIGKRYTAAQLNGKMLGKHAAVFDDVGMAKREREGEWWLNGRKTQRDTTYRKARIRENSESR
ncbi:hypothetical protein [Bacillus sp. FSL K6-3431]|uniref:hypothetical protein n=1 Tax=Bacillus sp. FSL K6-3431 TaxID=2921500 RepID=UPI0030F57E12